jgi:hypothetical protein
MSHCRASLTILLLTTIAAAGSVTVGSATVGSAAEKSEKPIVGLIPKAQKTIAMDGKLDDWQGAFVAPLHIGHPDFANRGAEFLYLWDDDNLYVGLRALDQKPWHNGTQVWDGDGVEFYLDTRRGDELGAKDFSLGSLHMFWTPFTKSEVAPRWQIRGGIPAFKDLKLKGVEIAGQKTSWGWTAEFKLPWANFPDFKAKDGEVIGIDCELCSSDGGPRSQRTFVYSSPANVATPSAFGRVKLVDKIDPAELKPFGRVLLPMSLTKSGNYDWLYGTACVSPTISADVAKVEGKLLDRSGKERKKSFGRLQTLEGSGLLMWTGDWEMFDLPSGNYTVELSALDKTGKVITSHSERTLHTRSK